MSKGLPKQGERDDHHAALPYAEVPAFVRTLIASDNSRIVRLAFEFLILTAARTGEVLGATWDKIDLYSAIWTLPPKRMKACREHRVPLAARCLEIPEQAAAASKSDVLVFPGRIAGKPLLIWFSDDTAAGW